MPTNKVDRVFYQFPLCALAYGANHEQRFQTIVSWCCDTAGAGLYEKMNRAKLKEYALNYGRESWPGCVSRNETRHLQFLAGMRKLEVCNGHIPSMIERVGSLQSFIDAMQNKHGRAPHVRIRNDLFWDAVKGVMPYRHFAVLAAIYACIGAKKYPVRITRDRIRAGMLGYKSPAMMTNEVMEQRQDKELFEVLTDRQIRTVLDHLEETSLFARVQTSARVVYFSNRMQADAMRKHLADWIGRRNTRAAGNREADREAMKKARLLKRSSRGQPCDGMTTG